MHQTYIFISINLFQILRNIVPNEYEFKLKIYIYIFDSLNTLGLEE